MLNLPDTYFMSAGFVGMLLVYGSLNLRTSWGIPYVVVVVTIAVWYLIEPIYFPDTFLSFPRDIAATAYDAVLITLFSFSISTSTSVDLMRPKDNNRILSNAYVPPERIFVVVGCLWLILLSFGIIRMQGDVFGALFPVGGRSSASMWQRAAGSGAGNDGFIVSAAGYVYVLCLALFGILYSLMSKRVYAILAMVAMMISWPYIVLQGARSGLLAVALPALGSYLLFSRHGLLRKGLVGGVSLAALELVLRIIIHFRNVGFEHVDLSQMESEKHLGLSMASELMYCIQYIENGTLDLSFGQRYLAELANVIPRVIWPDKPLIGIDYAVARGFGGWNNDIGVFATISTGVIGGGVLNFGPVFGPMWVGWLMSLWVGLLSRFLLQETPLRKMLFLIGLGLTFNLGRDITLLVLWPLVFGYVGVRVIEWRMSGTRGGLKALRPRTLA